MEWRCPLRLRENDLGGKPKWHEDEWCREKPGEGTIWLKIRVEAHDCLWNTTT